MRSGSSKSGSTNVSNHFSGKKSTSSLSKIGKHVPPPISPIISLKSSTATATTKEISTSGLKDSTSAEVDKSEILLVPASGTCAWRLPKSAEPETNKPATTIVYPQRKVPALTPAPPEKVVVTEEKPKSFLERFEEFPDLKKSVKKEEEEEGEGEEKKANEVANIKIQSQNKVARTSCIGGDFNFLEDDGWLDGDDIDYSQNLFQNDDHFLFPPPQPVNSICDVSKAKTLLAERSHSSEKQDIWKRSEERSSTEMTPSKIKIKILKRPESVEFTNNGNTKIETDIITGDTTIETDIITGDTTIETNIITGNTAKTSHTTSNIVKVKKFTTASSSKTAPIPSIPTDPEIVTEIFSNSLKLNETAGAPTKIVYSSASKKLQKKC